MFKYIIDASALINAKQYYPPENIPDFWLKLHELNARGNLIIIKKVKSELERGYDFLSENFFKDKVITNEEISEVVTKFPLIVNSLQVSQQGGFSSWLKDADPYLIGYALYLKDSGEKVMVLHGEKANQGKIRLPPVCKHFNIKNDSIDALIKEEKMKFRLSKD
jgi:hypothetical protein